ncbi:MAG: lysophospholipid acyltransferase family protein [bacterium]
MKSLKDALATATLGPEYAFLSKPPSLLDNAGKKIFEWYCKALFKFYCPLEVRGRENIPDSPFIFCSNHNSHMDTGVLMVSSGLPFKKFGMMAASDYFFENSKRRLFLGSLMNLIPVNRKPTYRSMVEATAACREFTKDRTRNIIIYPEGTRSLTGEIQSFKHGAAMIAAELKLPIVPVYIEGTHESMPKGRSFMKPRRIHATIGKPIHPEKFKGAGNNGKPLSGYRLLTTELEKTILKLKEENGVN